MLTFKWNGKDVKPEDIGKEMMKSVEAAIPQLAASELRERLASVRHPVTGEFPTVVVRDASLASFRFSVEGSPQLLSIVWDKLNAVEREHVELVSRSVADRRVFLSYAGPDFTIAEKIAHALHASGIDTWWAGWSLEAGQSLRQEIDKGLDACTHFVALLTPQSITRPWVKEEMDAGLVLHVEGKARFVPVRMDLSVDELPLLLQGKVSPSLDGDFDIQLKRLVSQVKGENRKPPLPEVAPPMPTHPGYSAAASKVARHFVERSEDGASPFPRVSIEELGAATGLAEEEVTDAVFELRDFLYDTFGVSPRAELFVEFDVFAMDWSPADDGLRICIDLMNDPQMPGTVAEAAARYGWSARRMNPAIAYLRSRDLIQEYGTAAAPPWVEHWLTKTDATRRFVNSRT